MHEICFIHITIQKDIISLFSLNSNICTTVEQGMLYSSMQHKTHYAMFMLHANYVTLPSNEHTSAYKYMYVVYNKTGGSWFMLQQSYMAEIHLKK